MNRFTSRLLALAGLQFVVAPRMQAIFDNISIIDCNYPVKVITFVDSNGNGVQDPGEPGISGITVLLKHLHPHNDMQHEKATTDPTGLAAPTGSGWCAPYDAVTVNVVPPAGYQATTALSFGPYSFPELYGRPVTAQAPPLPDAIYVGLRQNWARSS